MTQISQPTLLKFLEAKNGMLFGKSIEIRNAIKDWLAYIPQSFPHYTQHTIEHSDEIILQISKLIFIDDDPTQPVVQLSAVEAYILVAAAYLHDAGMVVSDKEKTEIIQSEEWISWITEGSSTKRWEEIKGLRNKTEFANLDVKNFVADLQTRFLIAEFVRRKHHTRASTIISEYQPLLGRFAFDNNLLLQAISNVCVGHGLDKYDLEDSQRFPDRSDIMGDSVNVRFLAILLRLGDLLDMQSDRACPLLLNAANPLPSDSLAHWTKHQRLTHRLTAPDKIEIVAECENQEEHRFLQDWCQWLVNETNNARELMARCTRHGTWKPPFASLHGSTQTITIQPSKSAKYIPNEWVFKLDPDVVYERLIIDLYADENAFIRELLQNAFDATRCKLYDDLKSANIETPEYPTQVNNEWLVKYPINISLETRVIHNDLSGEEEERQFIVIEDFGIGMDKSIIENYLLQVGHSFYTTEEFRRNYRFVGASRFGLGFLSVFSVSDYVVIETFKPSSQSKDGAIRLVLTGPKNYLLTEKCDRKISGTKIEIRLQRKLEVGQLIEIVKTWCKRVEFPIQVNEYGKHAVITAEKSDQFVTETPLISDTNSKFSIKSMPVNLPGISGEIYIFTYVDGTGEQWDQFYGARTKYIENEPAATVPTMPSDLMCLHGISIYPETNPYEPYSMRLDYRSSNIKPTLARDRSIRKAEIGIGDPHILSLWENILKDHLATTSKATSKKDGWKYKQRLSKSFDFLPSFWEALPETVRIIKNGRSYLLSINEVNEIPVITTYHSDSNEKMKTLKNNAYSIMPDDFKFLSRKTINSIFLNRRPIDVKKKNEDLYIISWQIHKSQDEKENDFTGRNGRPLSFIRLSNEQIGIVIHRINDSEFEHLLLNSNHPYIEWLQKTLEAYPSHQYEFKKEAIERLLKLTDDVIRYHNLHFKEFINYLDKWKNLPNLPSNLYPPEIDELPSGFLWLDPSAPYRVPVSRHKNKQSQSDRKPKVVHKPNG